MARPKSLDEFDPGYNTHVTAARNALYNAAGQMTHLECGSGPSGAMIENQTYNSKFS